MIIQDRIDPGHIYQRGGRPNFYSLFFLCCFTSFYIVVNGQKHLNEREVIGVYDKTIVKGDWSKYKKSDKVDIEIMEPPSLFTRIDVQKNGDFFYYEDTVNYKFQGTWNVVGDTLILNFRKSRKWSNSKDFWDVEFRNKYILQKSATSDAIRLKHPTSGNDMMDFYKE